ncbi:MAG TPA: phage holin family protein [Paludibacter sp.]|nr:phage holin family protein [Paludibacter sp.]
MANTQEPVGSFQQLYDDVRKYVELQAEYVKVEFVEKLAILLSTLLIIGLVVVLVIVALFYLFFSLAYALLPLLGSLALSFGVISGVYVLLIVFFLTFRRKIVINPLVRFLSNLFLKNQDDL